MVKHYFCGGDQPDRESLTQHWLRLIEEWNKETHREENPDACICQKPALEEEKGR